MTEEQVLVAVQSAAREAFAMGMRAAVEKPSREKLRTAAMTYAEDLVMAVARLAIDDAREQGWIGGRAERDAGAGGT